VWLICRLSPHHLLVREIEGEPTISLANTWWRIRALSSKHYEMEWQRARRLTCISVHLSFSVWQYSSTAGTHTLNSLNEFRTKLKPSWWHSHTIDVMSSRDLMLAFKWKMFMIPGHAEWYTLLFRRRGEWWSTLSFAIIYNQTEREATATREAGVNFELYMSSQ